MARLPYPIAYNFFTKDYQKRVSYNKYLQSFAGIGHINLIKMNRLPDEKGIVPYFIELESIEGSSPFNFESVQKPTFLGVNFVYMEIVTKLYPDELFSFTFLFYFKSSVKKYSS